MIHNKNGKIVYGPEVHYNFKTDILASQYFAIAIHLIISLLSKHKYRCYQELPSTGKLGLQRRLTLCRVRKLDSFFDV